MKVTVHKPNVQFIKDQAEKIRSEGDGTGDKDLVFYEWKTGENNLRLLPPWSAKGMVFKKVLTHFELPPEKSVYKCQLTWPDKFHQCVICEALEKVQAMFPEIDLGRQRPALQYYGNIIDRDEEEKGAQLCRFTPTVFNWIILQMDNPKIGDVTDYEKGFDLIITKTVKPRKGRGESIKYSCSFVPGACPLHDSDDVIAQWLSGIFDVDRVYGPVDNDMISEMQGCSSRMITYYQRKNRSGDIGPRSDDPGDTADDGEDPPPRTRKDRPTPSETSPGSIETLSDLDPKKVPSCHAKLEAPDAHDDGSYGFNPALEKCLLCPFEMACMDAKASRGI